MGGKLKWAGPRHKTPRMKIIMALAAWKKKKKAQAEMQCKSAKGKRDEPAEALSEGRGGIASVTVKDTDPHHLRNNAAR